jgi:hypothetical protein
MQIKHQIKNSYQEYKRNKEKLNFVKTKIKEEINERYSYLTDEDRFRYGINLYFGDYTKKFHELSKRLSISMAKDRNQNYCGFYVIYKGFPGRFGWTEDNKLSGFICYEKDLFTALNNKLKNLWIFSVNEKRYLLSFDDFVSSCRNKEINLFDLYSEYISDKEYVFEKIHFPNLKVNRMILYIEDKFYF